jgi:prolyl 4-hydroxylase
MHPIRTAIQGDAIFTVAGVCSPVECEGLIRVADDIGYEAAPITVGPQKFLMAPDIRNNTRVILDDPARAAMLWRRLAPFVPARQGAWRAVGLNERLRFYRYTRGQYFEWHRDGAYVRDERERSLLTVMLYLSEGIAGGTTDFDARAGEFTVTPRTGTALVFEHHIRHRGAPVERGVKLVLRTDVMYRREEA